MSAYRDERPALGQDGFSATVRGADEAAAQQDGGVTRRPWRDGHPAQEAQAEHEAAHERGVVQSAPQAAFVPRAVEFAQNGDGTLTAVRLTDRDADDLDIQAEAGSAPVTAIAPRAFEGSALRRVILPEALRQIGEMAFSGCARLQQVSVPGGVARVGTLAFAKCASLSHVRLEPGVQALGPSCFSKCASLTRVDMPASVTVIGGGAFFGCGKRLVLCGAAGGYAQRYAALNGIAFDSERWREDEALVFAEEWDGTLTVTGPRQSAPEQIDIPGEVCGRRVARIAPKAFFACGSLTRLSVGGVREIGESAFFGCRSLASARFERGLQEVGDSAFAGCEALAQVTLPWGTEHVGRMAFFGCSRLSFAKLPAATRVEDFAFDGCAQGLRVFGGVHVGRIPEQMREYGRDA